MTELVPPGIADRERIAAYVRRALPKMLQRAGCDWPCEVEWDELGIRAHLSRGDLVISDFVWQHSWWEPAIARRVTG